MVLDAAVILAGGGGTRLWPWTSAERPKPLLPLGGGGRSLLAATLARFEGLVDPSHVFLQCSAALGERLLAAEPLLTRALLRIEPSARDTGPAVALAMRRIAAVKGDALVLISPADHRIGDVPAFQAALRAGAEAASAGALVVLGITPNSPSTRFGYVEVGEESSLAPRKDTAREVVRFVEKPDLPRAEAFLASGRFYWNAGLFLWRADAFERALGEHAPELAQAVDAFAVSGDPADWERAPRLSIDYALMERAQRVALVPLDAGWDDVGGWDAVVRLARAGDAGPARIVELPRAPAGSLALAIEDEPGEFIVVGDEPLLVVTGPEGTLVAPLDRADEVKRFVR